MTSYVFKVVVEPDEDAWYANWRLNRDASTAANALARRAGARLQSFSDSPTHARQAKEVWLHD